MRARDAARAHTAPLEEKRERERYNQLLYKVKLHRSLVRDIYGKYIFDCAPRAFLFLFVVVFFSTFGRRGRKTHFIRRKRL